jgi:hypothetical protein
MRKSRRTEWRKHFHCATAQSDRTKNGWSFILHLYCLSFPLETRGKTPFLRSFSGWGVGWGLRTTKFLHFLSKNTQKFPKFRLRRFSSCFCFMYCRHCKKKIPLGVFTIKLRSARKTKVGYTLGKGTCFYTWWNSPYLSKKTPKYYPSQF